MVGINDGIEVGVIEGVIDGMIEGGREGEKDGASVGITEGCEGCTVGSFEGSMMVHPPSDIILVKSLKLAR